MQMRSAWSPRGTQPKDSRKLNRPGAPPNKTTCGVRRMLRNFPLGKAYQLLEPGPVVFLTTIHCGQANVMTMSWHMMVEFDPPRIACVVSAANFSFQALRQTRQCVIAIPSADLVSTIVAIGNCSGRDVDKFAAFGLTQLAGRYVASPLVAECFSNLECKVIDTRMVKKYNIFIMEAVKVWINQQHVNRKTVHHHGYGKFVVDGKTVILKSTKP